MPVYDQKKQKVNNQYNVNIGITLEEHEKSLEKRENEVRTALKTAHEAEKNIFLKELSDVSQKLSSLEKSYGQRVEFLKERIDALKKLHHDFPEKILKNAEQALGNGDESKADDLFRQIEEKASNHIKQAAEAAYQRGLIAEEQIRYFDALNYFKRAAQLVQDNSTYLNKVGLLAHHLACYDKAIEFHEKALKVDLDSFGDKHPTVATAWNNLGQAWYAKGEYDKAIEFHEKALKVYLDSLGDKHPTIATAWNNLGVAWRAKGEYDKAIEFHEKALKVDLDSFGDKHPDVARDWNNLGLAWMEKSDYGRAIECYEKASKINLDSLGDKHSKVGIDWNNLGGAWHAKGNYDKAIEYYEKASKVIEDVLGKKHPYFKTLKSNIEITMAKMN
ncbi:MAG TPA: tetratricopeptide repeat protein [Saprospiraceae bacterium]|nr:tetratricopeptide repeat protein [Saprospiraceae bacterium]